MIEYLDQLGGTKKQELIRSAEHFADLCKSEDPYFGLAFLVDAGYDKDELREILSYMKPAKTWKSKYDPQPTHP